MSVFVDTSAVYALLTQTDRAHSRAAEAWADLQAQQETLVTSNYVLLESSALIGRRLGLEAVRTLHSDVEPLMGVIWVESTVHEEAMALLLARGERDLSLVDCVSFSVMRRGGIEVAFAFDAHFVQQGFRCLPEQPARTE